MHRSIYVALIMFQDHEDAEESLASESMIRCPELKTSKTS